MINKSLLLCLSILLAASFSLNAQIILDKESIKNDIGIDKLYLINGDSLEAHVSLMNKKFVIYQTELKDESPFITLKARDVQKIVFSNKTEVFVNQPKIKVNNSREVQTLNNSLSINVIEPLYKVASITFETKIGNDKYLHLRAGTGFDGAALFSPEDNRGYFFRTGIRFILSKNKVMDYTSNNKVHPLNQFYVRPVITFNSSKKSFENDEYINEPFFTNVNHTYKYNYNEFGFLFEVGKGFVFDKNITIDISGGLGYRLYEAEVNPEYSSKSAQKYYQNKDLYGYNSYRYDKRSTLSHIGGSDSPILASLQFQVGFIF
jgi:hypothetical protein